MHVVILSVIQAFVNVLGHHTVMLVHIKNIVKCTTAAKVGFAVHANVFFGFVFICLTHNPQFSQVEIAFVQAQQLGFKQSKATVAPACTCTVLVFYGGNRNVFHGFKLIGIVFFFLVFL